MQLRTWALVPTARRVRQAMAKQFREDASTTATAAEASHAQHLATVHATHNVRGTHARLACDD